MKCSDYLTSCNNQLGLKSAHSTDLCIYTLKEYIEYYKNRETTVYVTFLDASKAFDRLNYWLLFDKLVKKHVPLFIIKLLCCWCTIKKNVCPLGCICFNPVYCCQWGETTWNYSLILFNVYMDDLSIALNSSSIGRERVL